MRNKIDRKRSNVLEPEETTMTLRIGVIGAGIMGADHVETLGAAISGAEVRAVADLDPKRAETIASRVPGALRPPQRGCARRLDLRDHRVQFGFA